MLTHTVIVPRLPESARERGSWRPSTHTRLASVLRLLLNEYGIYDVGTLAANVHGAAGDALADWLESDSTRALFASLVLEQPATTNVSTQSEEELVEVDVAEAMIFEAVTTGDERIAAEVTRRVAAEERAQHAELFARQLQNRLEDQLAVLEGTEERGAARERASREAAEQRAAEEQTLRRAAEQLAADAAARATMAEQRAVIAEQRAAAAEAKLGVSEAAEAAEAAAAAAAAAVATVPLLTIRHSLHRLLLHHHSHHRSHHHPIGSLSYLKSR